MACDTIIHSPTYDEIMMAVKNAYEVGFCFQTNPPATNCKQLASYKGGQIWLCGKYGLGVDCKWVVQAAIALMLQCGKNGIGRAGGWITLTEKLALVVC
jgi:hypothetical protein